MLLSPTKLIGRQDPANATAIQELVAVLLLLLGPRCLGFSFLWLLWKKKRALGDWFSQLLDRQLERISTFFNTSCDSFKDALMFPLVV